MKTNEFIECFTEYVNIRNGEYMNEETKTLFKEMGFKNVKIDELELLQNFLEVLTHHSPITIEKAGL